MSERFKIIRNAPVKIYVASAIDRYWYPYRLQAASNASEWAKEECLELIMDSAIGDAAVGNAEVLDAACEYNADFVVPADTLHNQSETTEAVREFMTLYRDHECRAKPLVPLQPPYHEHYRELDGHSHYVLGGIATSDPEVQLKEIRRFRREAGYGVYAHGLGLGASLRLIRELRENPRLLDSLDLSTTEQHAINDRIADATWQQKEHHYPTGANSSTVRAAYANAAVMQLNYMLSPFCDDDLLKSEWQQSTLSTSVAATDGGSHD